MSRMISELVVDHDRVGLPGVGTFYADVVPSTFSDRGYTINPPYRRLSFLPNAVENDLLVNFYSEVNGIPADVAREYLTQFLSELAAVLRKRKSIMLPGLGRLRRRTISSSCPTRSWTSIPKLSGWIPCR